ncbi:ABC transporter permease [Paenibacillus shirakamiensis]|uniref:ABC transporter permease n=1 Tax=Paenibacillus shirakamiensis TaxID=1265935 RepID=UPI00315A383F
MKEKPKHSRSIARKGVHPYIYRGISASAVIVAGLLWWLISSLHVVSSLFMPSPAEVWAAFLEIIKDGYKGETLLGHIGASLWRLFVAISIAFVTAVPLGILCGRFRWLQAIFDPFVEFYRPLPPLAYYSLLVLWFGIEDTSKILLLFLSAFAPLFITSVYSVQRVPKDRISGATSLGAKGWSLYIYIIFPSCLPDLLTALRTAVGVAYSTLVAAEMVAAISGIGWMVLDASKFLRSDVIYVGIIIMGVIAVLIDVLIRSAMHKWCPWTEQS